MEWDTSKRNSFISNFRGTRVFIAKMLVGLAIFAIYINSLLPQYEQGYNASLIDKVNRLESITEPKIVLIGNSNVAFGIDSKLLEDEMGMPVVNMGMHGGLGNAFHEEMAKLNVTPGDIYVICHASFNDDDKIENTELAWVTIENHFHLWKLLRFCDIKEMVKSFPVYLKKSMTLASSGTGNRTYDLIYARTAFNEYGDIEVERIGRFHNGEKKRMEVVPKVGDIAINRINALYKYLISKGAILLIAGYPIRNGNVTVDSYQYVLFQEKLSEKMECPVISNYVDYMFDYRYFFDTNYHLNSEGATLRTIQLVSDLKEWLQFGSNAIDRKEKYVDIVTDVKLPHIDDFYEYIDVLNNAKNRYTVFISCKNGVFLRENTMPLDTLKTLGLSADRLMEKNNYVAVIENGSVIQEIVQYENVELSGEVDDGKIKYSISIDGKDKEGSSIRLNGEECSENTNGLNIVVYSNETHRRIDEVGFEFSMSEIKAKRFVIKS